MNAFRVATLSLLLSQAAFAQGENPRARAKADSIARAKGLVPKTDTLASRAGAIGAAKNAAAAASAHATGEQPAAGASTPAQGAGGRGAPPAQAGQGAGQSAASTLVALPQMTLQREVFTYASAGKRDPMVSLMNTGEIRPLITELKVMSILYDETGSNHVAVLFNVVDKKTQYRVRVGQTLGRMKVAAITRREVVFTVQEFGMDRQERLSIKPDTTRKQ